MGIVTAEELFTYASQDSETRGNVNNWAGYRYWSDKPEPLPPVFTMDQVQGVLDTIHSKIVDGNFLDWKAMRPWNIVDVSDHLDPAKAWIGWEIETGWDDRESRSRAIEKLFSTYNHVATDSEGPAYGVEMTWAPANGGVYEGQHPLLFAVEIAREGNIYEHDDDDSVGTHVNISTPSYRLLKRGAQEEVSSAMTKAICDTFSYDDNKELFGRGNLYGAFFTQASWIEGKLFNTTYDAGIARGYIKVAERLAEVIEILSAFMLDDANDVDHGKLEVEGMLEYLYDGRRKKPVPVIASRSRFFWGDSVYDRDYDDDNYDYDDECDCEICVADREENY